MACGHCRLIAAGRFSTLFLLVNASAGAANAGKSSLLNYCIANVGKRKVSTARAEPTWRALARGGAAKVRPAAAAACGGGACREWR
eukprot:6176944-Pleurochrysis_carterae.AAC.1